MWAARSIVSYGSDGELFCLTARQKRRALRIARRQSSKKALAFMCRVSARYLHEKMGDR